MRSSAAFRLRLYYLMVACLFAGSFAQAAPSADKTAQKPEATAPAADSAPTAEDAAPAAEDAAPAAKDAAPTKESVAEPAKAKKASKAKSSRKTEPKAKPEDSDEEEGDAEDEDDEPSETAQATVPSDLRNRGYSLRIDDELVEIDRPVLTLTRSRDTSQIDLIDHRKRVLASQDGYVDEHVFESLEPRTWRVALFLGGGSSSGDAFDDLLVGRHFSTITLEGNYQPGPLGATLQLASISADKEVEEEIDVSYLSSQTRLGVTYEMAPFPSGGNLERAHLTASLGAFTASHEIEITDGVVSLRDESRNAGVFFGTEIAFPINSFWLMLRGILTYQRIRFDDFDFQTKSVQRSLELGGAYGF